MLLDGDGLHLDVHVGGEKTDLEGGTGGRALEVGKELVPNLIELVVVADIVDEHFDDHQILQLGAGGLNIDLDVLQALQSLIVHADFPFVGNKVLRRYAGGDNDITQLDARGELVQGGFDSGAGNSFLFHVNDLLK